MKAIGFTTQYYTLWDIQVEPQFSTNTRGQVISSWDKINYCYLGNLSKDLVKAQEKAKEKGCSNLEPDHDLYGRNRSFEIFTPKKIVKEGLESCEKSELLMICCSNDKENTKEAREIAVKILLSKKYVKEIGGVLVDQDRVGFYEKWINDRKIFLDAKITDTFFIANNVNCEGVLIDGNTSFCFTNGSVQQYYNGFNYYLPKGKDGKAKRIKNKTIELLDFEVSKECDEFPYNVWNEDRANFKFFTGDSFDFFGKIEIKVNDFNVKK